MHPENISCLRSQILYLLGIDIGIHVNAEGHHPPNKYESCHFGPSTRPKNRFQYSMEHPGNHTVNTQGKPYKILISLRHFEYKLWLPILRKRGSVKITSTAEGFAFWCFDGYFCSCPKSIYPKGGMNVRGGRPRLQISIIWTPLFRQFGKGHRNVSLDFLEIKDLQTDKKRSQIHSR